MVSPELRTKYGVPGIAANCAGIAEVWCPRNCGIVRTKSLQTYFRRRNSILFINSSYTHHGGLRYSAMPITPDRDLRSQTGRIESESGDLAPCMRAQINRRAVGADADAVDVAQHDLKRPQPSIESAPKPRAHLPD